VINEGARGRTDGEERREGRLQLFSIDMDLGAGRRQELAFQAAASEPPATTAFLPSSLKNTGRTASGAMRRGAIGRLDWRAAIAIGRFSCSDHRIPSESRMVSPSSRTGKVVTEPSSAP
jgi:hypothetical protein